MRDLENIRIETNFTLEVGDHRAGTFFLHLAAEVSFGYPRRAVAEFVGELCLGKKIFQHHPLGGLVAVHRGLADGKENIEAHGPTIEEEGEEGLSGALRSTSQRVGAWSGYADT